MVLQFPKDLLNGHGMEFRKIQINNYNVLIIIHHVNYLRVSIRYLKCFDRTQCIIFKFKVKNKLNCSFHIGNQSKINNNKKMYSVRL